MEKATSTFPVEVEEFSVRFSLGIHTRTRSTHVFVTYNLKGKGGTQP